MKQRRILQLHKLVILTWLIKKIAYNTKRKTLSNNHWKVLQPEWSSPHHDKNAIVIFCKWLSDRMNEFLLKYGWRNAMSRLGKVVVSTCSKKDWYAHWNWYHLCSNIFLSKNLSLFILLGHIAIRLPATEHKHGSKAKKLSVVELSFVQDMLQKYHTNSERQRLASLQCI